eukprot:357300-Pyramimonas_sp.AAC.1
MFPEKPPGSSDLLRVRISDGPSGVKESSSNSDAPLGEHCRGMGARTGPSENLSKLPLCS